MPGNLPVLARVVMGHDDNARMKTLAGRRLRKAAEETVKRMEAGLRVTRMGGSLALVWRAMFALWLRPYSSGPIRARGWR